MKNIAVLGCGPTGLLVAHAFWVHGHVVNIFSRKEKSVIPGSQHLHGPVPGVTSLYPEGTIQFVRMGTAEGYAKKVYDDPKRNTGWENYLQVYPSWNVIRAYDFLWEGWEEKIIDSEFLGEISGDKLREMTLGYDLVVSTLPAQALCYKNHTFRGSHYWIRPLETPPEDENHDIVVYNGLPEDPWYRWSILGGLCSIEYAKSPEDDNGIKVGLKAIDNDCDCYPKIVRLGRWSEWRHGVTMHNAYLRAAAMAEIL